MPNSDSVQKRTQFSSCDACRRSRVACDASRLGHQPGKVDWRGSCSRCVRKKRACTFEWISNAKETHSRSRQESRPQSSIRGRAHLNSESSWSRYSSPLQDANFSVESQEVTLVPDDSSRRSADVDIENSDLIRSALDEPSLNEQQRSHARSIDRLLDQWSQHVFDHGFEALFGLSIGRNSCPFVNDPDSDICIPSAKVFATLDSYVDKDPNCLRSNHYAPLIPTGKQERNLEIDRSLKRAIKCFVSRWLPLIPRNSIQLTTSEWAELIKEHWRTSRKDMLKVINRESYRSVLTLYLFSQTPVPAGITEAEESDGISSLICFQTALLQVQRLRERQKSWSHDLLPPPSSSEAISTLSSAPSQVSLATQAYLDYENRAYWAAVLWDTTTSLTSDFRASLTAGLKGACSEPAWRLSRAFLVGSFHPKTSSWRAGPFEVSDDAAAQILSAADVSKLYVWKTIASLREALREGVDEDDVTFAWKAFLDANKIFRKSIHPLLKQCERQLQFLNQLQRLSWYRVNLQYYLGILVMVDAIEVAHRPDLLAQVTEERMDAEYECLNVLKFGIENVYTIKAPREKDPNAASDLNNGGDDTEHRGKPITLPFVAMDPSPQHVIETVVLMNKTIRRKYCDGKIKREAYSHLSSILIKNLESLPQSSKSVCAALETVKQSFEGEDIVHVSDDAICTARDHS